MATNRRMRVVAERALRVLDAHRAGAPQLAEVGLLLEPLAHAYINAFDDHKAHETVRRDQMGEGWGAIRALHALMRTWSSALEAAIPGFSESSLTGTLNQPDEVLSNAKWMIGQVENHRERLASSDALLTTLRQHLERATVEWVNAQRKLVADAMLEAAVAESKGKLWPIFKAFRTTVGRLLGRSHRDYSCLRTHRNRRIEDADEQLTDAAAQPVDPTREAA
jgi:hypothetical protein